MDQIARVQGILFRPRVEWKKIKAEKTSLSDLFSSYVLILAAIPAAAQFIGIVLFRGVRIPYSGDSLLVRTFFYSVLYYLISVGTVYLLGLVINTLAASFSSKPDLENAMKLAAFSLTPVWIAGVLRLSPRLAVLAGLAGLYGIYILYAGFNESLMDTPKDKIAGYFTVSLVIGIVLVSLMSLILWLIFFGRALLGFL